MEIQGLYERNPTAGVEQCRDFLASSERFSFLFIILKFILNYLFILLQENVLLFSILNSNGFFQLPLHFTSFSLFIIHRKVFFQLPFSFYSKKTFPYRAGREDETDCRFVMVRRGDVYGLMVEQEDGEDD